MNWIIAITIFVLVACNEHDLPTSIPPEVSSVGISSIASSSSAEIAFSFGSMLDQADQPHKTILVEEQEWMAENLRYLPRTKGSAVCGDTAATTECKDGAHYQYSEAQTVCPSPWRLPSDKDWQKLVLKAGREYQENCETTDKYVFASDLAYKHFPSDSALGSCVGLASHILKADSSWENSQGNDGLHFGGLPKGYKDISKEWFQVGKYAYFWSSDTIANQILDSDKNSASSWYLTKSTAVVHETNLKDVWMSVRCVRDVGSSK